MKLLPIILLLTSCQTLMDMPWPDIKGDPYFIMRADAQVKQYKESGMQDVDRILYHIKTQMKAEERR